MQRSESECYLQTADKVWSVILVLKRVIRVPSIETQRSIVQIITFKIDANILVDRILDFSIHLEVPVEMVGRLPLPNVWLAVPSVPGMVAWMSPFSIAGTIC
jgi:hypothetical protein